MLKPGFKTIFTLALLLFYLGVTASAEVYPADTYYPVRICGRFHMESNRLYLEVRQTFDNDIIDFLLVPRRLPMQGSTPPMDPSLEDIAQEAIDRVKKLTTQSSPIFVVGCAYSGIFSIIGEKPTLVIEKLTAKKTE